MAIALLSHALVALTIELDNEFEHRMPHSTTLRRRPGLPWLISFAMWENCLRFVSDDGVTIRELTRLARTTTNLRGMQAWRYISVSPTRVITLTAAGKRAQATWAPLPAEIEARWRERFGGDTIDRLRQQLAAIVSRSDTALPDYLPILGYGLVTRPSDSLDPEHRNATDLPLSALLSKVLLRFALEYERESPVSLAIGANVLRLVGDDGARVRDLPRLSGVSKEAIAMATGFLHKQGYAIVGGNPKTIALTPKGRAARETYHRLTRDHQDLTELPTDLLLRGIEPYPDGWRAMFPKRETLPHFPMVLHRGGYPDGA